MKMIQEENSLMPLAEHVEVAKGGLLDELHQLVSQIAEQRYLGQVEAVNKAFYR
jgi:hypothetical protein